MSLSGTLVCLVCAILYSGPYMAFVASKHAYRYCLKTHRALLAWLHPYITIGVGRAFTAESEEPRVQQHALAAELEQQIEQQQAIASKLAAQIAQQQAFASKLDEQSVQQRALAAKLERQNEKQQAVAVKLDTQNVQQQAFATKLDEQNVQHATIAAKLEKLGMRQQAMAATLEKQAATLTCAGVEIAVLRNSKIDLVSSLTGTQKLLPDLIAIKIKLNWDVARLSERLEKATDGGTKERAKMREHIVRLEAQQTANKETASKCIYDVLSAAQSEHLAIRAKLDEDVARLSRLLEKSTNVANTEHTKLRKHIKNLEDQHVAHKKTACESIDDVKSAAEVELPAIRAKLNDEVVRLSDRLNKTATNLDTEQLKLHQHTEGVKEEQARHRQTTIGWISDLMSAAQLEYRAIRARPGDVMTGEEILGDQTKRITKEVGKVGGGPTDLEAQSKKLQEFVRLHMDVEMGCYGLIRSGNRFVDAWYLPSTRGR